MSYFKKKDYRHSKQHKGNKAAQNKRRRARAKHNIPKTPYEVELIDGNFTYYPVSYCTYHQGYLTEGIQETHHCINRNCQHLEPLYEKGEMEI